MKIALLALKATKNAKRHFPKISDIWTPKTSRFGVFATIWSHWTNSWWFRQVRWGTTGSYSDLLLLLSRDDQSQRTRWWKYHELANLQRQTHEYFRHCRSSLFPDKNQNKRVKDVKWRQVKVKAVSEGPWTEREGLDKVNAAFLVRSSIACKLRNSRKSMFSCPVSQPQVS